MRSTKALISGIFVFLLLSGCDNPFAPRISSLEQSGSGLFSDQKTIDGVFRNLQYAYSLRDTLYYGPLLDQEFTFTYRDYDLGFDVTWGREEDIRTTAGLFSNSERLELIWNNIITSSEDSTSALIIRGFNLTITFNPSDIVRIDGRVNLSMKKNEQGVWKIIKWIDESNL